MHLFENIHIKVLYQFCDTFSKSSLLS